MRLAILSVTQGGALLGQTLAKTLAKDGHQISVFGKRGRSLEGTHEFDSLSVLIAEIFHRYDGLVFIMATGITVRVIAPHVQDKRTDPAVVVVDEQGQHAISLLSGHIGNANELTAQISWGIGAQAVITTATDVHRRPAADTLASRLNLTIEPFEQLKYINAALVHNEPVEFFLDSSLPLAGSYQQIARQLGIDLKDLKQLAHTTAAAVVITDQPLPLTLPTPHLFLKPRSLAVGIGCRRGTSAELIWEALSDACQRIVATPQQIRRIASVDLKADEAGLLAVIDRLKIPSHFYSSQELAACNTMYHLEESNFVKEQIGVGNVCAAAAILAGQSSRLLLPKTKYKEVTIAIVEDTSPS